jgi:hypothetical protein
VRLGPPTVVRLERALAHERLRRDWFEQKTLIRVWIPAAPAAIGSPRG